MEHTFAGYDTTDNVQVALKETLDEDIDFHTCIAECSGNPIIISQNNQKLLAESKWYWNG